MKAIPTTYRNTHFRSRLEARWARALDRLNMRWAYEQESFTFGDGLRYLPDFYLPDQHVFVEVKGVLDGQSWDKVASLNTRVETDRIGVVLATANGAVEAIGPWSGGQGQSFPMPQCFGLALCAACDQWFFLDTSADRTCRRCLSHDNEDRHIAGWFTQRLPRWAWG